MFELFGWVIIKHPWSLTFKEFYIVDKDGKSNCVVRSLCKILNKEYDALINVGSNPTINDEKSLKIEANILNFNEDIYDDKIIAIFTYFKREEVKSNSLNDLKKQIEKDYNDLLKYLNM